MEDNPFIKIIEQIRTDNKEHYPTTYRFGRVISINPLKVEVDSLELDKEAFMKSSQITTFELNDDVLLIPIEDEQRYIILAKVVDA